MKRLRCTTQYSDPTLRVLEGIKLCAFGATGQRAEKTKEKPRRVPEQS